MENAEPTWTLALGTRPRKFVGQVSNDSLDCRLRLNRRGPSDMSQPCMTKRSVPVCDMSTEEAEGGTLASTKDAEPKQMLHGQGKRALHYCGHLWQPPSSIENLLFWGRIESVRRLCQFECVSSRIFFFALIHLLGDFAALISTATTTTTTVLGGTSNSVPRRLSYCPRKEPGGSVPTPVAGRRVLANIAVLGLQLLPGQHGGVSSLLNLEQHPPRGRGQVGPGRWQWRRP
mmetsp:Transcript_7949/g.22173  ORF Transcript_7949/g.22173 Transcript_7949/m.22173 type:complete len:231 (+) Transcript_7949:207-899(+)